MSAHAHVLLKLLNELGKRNKIQGSALDKLLGQLGI